MPTGPQLHHDALLSNMAVAAFSTQDDELIADRVFPLVDVVKESDRYAIINAQGFLRLEGTFGRRARKDRAKSVEFTVSCDRYFADNYALTGELAIEDINNADNPFMLRDNTVKLVVSQLKRLQEQRVANLLTSISNIGSGVVLAGSSRWSQDASSPISDVTTAHAFIRQNTGLRANTLVMDEDTLETVRKHPEILDYYKYTSGGLPDDQMLAKVFRVDRILRGSGVIENQIEGSNTSSITNLWGNAAILLRVAPAIGMQTATLGLRFGWRNPQYPANFGVMRKVENEAGDRHVEVIEVGHFQDEKIVARNLGYAITTTI